MNLTEAKRLFFKLRAQNQIDICEEHITGDHPEREYTFDEVVSLVKAPGVLQDTNDPVFSGERFYWRTKDVLERNIRLIVEFEQDENGQLILVISAGERT